MEANPNMYDIRTNSRVSIRLHFEREREKQLDIKIMFLAESTRAFMMTTLYGIILSQAIPREDFRTKR